MTKDEIENIWDKAKSMSNNEELIRYEFAKLIAANEREICASLADYDAPWIALMIRKRDKRP